MIELKAEVASTNCDVNTWKKSNIMLSFEVDMLTSSGVEI